MFRIQRPTNYIIILFLFSLASCANKEVILKHKHFQSGDWLLVNQNHVENTVRIIDDEAILLTNPDGIKVVWKDEHAYTTCDGTISLYQDGELIMKQNYLSDSYIDETKNIEKAYRIGSIETIIPKDNTHYKLQWDSLKGLPMHYPTKYHMQPEDIDVIELFSYE